MRAARLGLHATATALALALALAACGGGKAATDAATCSEPPPARSGEATYYDADGSGNCSFDPVPAGDTSDLLVAAMNGPEYDTAAWCGGCVEVDGPAGTVVVRITDQCPGCASGDLDLSRAAFARIANPKAGRVPITWREVPCDVGSGAMRYRFKDGSNAFWTAIQVRDHRYPIARLEAQRADGTFRELARASYNYFVAADGLGTGPYTLRVTDDRGHAVLDPGIALGDATTVDGAAQLPACE